MIIDIHTHLFSWDIPPKPYWDITAEVLASSFGKPLEKVRERLPGLWDPMGDMLVRDMDEAGIDKSALLLLDFCFGELNDTASLEEQHRVYAEAAERHPGRLIPFAGIDPRRPGAVEFLQRAVQEWQIKGVKIHPCVGFYPTEPCAYRLYEKCQELGLVVLAHTGPEPPPLYTKYAQPVFFDDVATDFPNLTIIMAHAGMAQWEESAMLANANPNLYLDLASWQKPYIAIPEEEFYRRIRTILNLAGRSRLLFGSDWPVLTRIRKLNHAAWVGVFKEARERAGKFGIEFSDEEINGILGDNAARLLRLSAS